MPDIKQRIPPWKRKTEQNAPVATLEKPERGRPVSMEELLAGTRSILSNMPTAGASDDVTQPLRTPSVLKGETGAGTTTRYPSREAYETLGLDPDKFLGGEGKQEPSVYKKIDKMVQEAAKYPFFQFGMRTIQLDPETKKIKEEETLPPGISLINLAEIGVGAQIGVAGYQALTQGAKAISETLMRAAFNRNINKWSMDTGKPISAQARAEAEEWFANRVKPSWANTMKSFGELFKPSVGGKYKPTSTAEKAADSISKEIVSRVAPELAKFTKTNTGVPGQTRSIADILSSMEGVTPATAQVAHAGRMELTPEKPPTPEVTPTAPEKGVTPANTGEAIATQLGIRYDGIQEGIGMQFTEPTTGTTFYAQDLESAKAKVAEKIVLFAKAKPPITPEVTPPKAEAVFGEADAGLQRSMLADIARETEAPAIKTPQGARENVIAGRQIFTSPTQKAATDGETIYINTSAKFQTEAEIDKFFQYYKGTIVAKDLERARKIISNTREGVIAHEQGHSFSDSPELRQSPFMVHLGSEIRKIWVAEETALRAKKPIGRPPLLSSGLTKGENLNVASEEIPQQYALYKISPELQKKYFPEIYKLFNENKPLVGKYILPVKNVAPTPTAPTKGVTPAVTPETGQSIAKQLGIRYDGIQEGIGMQFTEPTTGTTFYAQDLESAKAKVAEKIVLFAKAKPPITPEVTPPKSEDIAVTEVAGAPPKPPKDWDKIGGGLYDKFKKNMSEPTPNTVPVSDRWTKAWSTTKKITADEFARLNELGWQAELDVAMVRASGSQSGQLYRETMKAITKNIGNDSNLISYVDDYLLLRHQLEVLKATDRKYFLIKKGDKSVRFTAKQIGLLFAQMKKELGDANYAKVKEAAGHVPAVYNQVLKGSQELTPEQISGLIKKYPWYNPIVFARDKAPINIGRRLSPRQIKELTTLESDKEQISPLMSLPTTLARRMRAQAINEARKSVAELAVDPKNLKLVGGEVEIVSKKPEGAFVDYFDKGERKYLKLGKGAEWIAQEIEMIQRQPPGMTIRMQRSLQNLTKMFMTTYNLGFVAWNTTFDGMVSYFSEGIGPWGYGKALAGNIKAMFTEVPGVAEFRRSGGELFGYFEKPGMEGFQYGEREKVVSPFVSAKKGQLILKNPESLKRFINPFVLIRELGIVGENAGRRATYEKAIKEGLSPKEAALRARRVIVDFSRFSQASRIINDWYIYFNPAMQGLLLPGRAIKKNPKSLWRLGALVAGYMALVLYNQSYDEYDDVRNADKTGKLLVMLPSDEYNKYGQKVPHYLTLLPLREFAVFTAPIEYLMGKLRTKEPEAYRTIAQEFGYLYPAVSPLSMISESGGLVMPTQVAATIQQIMANHDDFRNKPIVDDEMELLPPAQQYDQYTNTLAIRIGQALNMSPKKLDFFVSNMFGNLGNDALRTIDMAIQQVDREAVDERIAGLVNELRSISTTVPPNRIEVARESFLERLSVEDRELVLNMEKLPEKDFPFIQSIFRRFYRDYGGQVYQTAKEKVLQNRTLEDYPPEAIEELQESALENANNLLKGKIDKYNYDKNRTRYRAYYSGASTAEWRQGMKEGAVSRSEVDKYMPEAYKRAEEFQAVSAYMEIQGKYIDEAGGVSDAETWDSIEQRTLAELNKHYSYGAVQYAIAHKDDWIDKLPEPARTVERDRARAIEDESWWDDYREVTKPTRPVGAGTHTPPWKQ